MNRQQRALPYLISKCCEIDPNCGIQLQGSVARGEEQPESDIDLTVILRDITDIRYNELITPDNHPGMIRVYHAEFDVNIDINWEFASRLNVSLTTHGAAGWYIFSQGRPIYDPLGLAKQCQNQMLLWFNAHSSIAQAWEKQHNEVHKQKKNPHHKLEFPTFADFHSHLKDLLSEK